MDQAKQTTMVSNTGTGTEPATGDALEARAQRALLEWVARANKLFEAVHGVHILCPRLAFDLRGRSAGLAIFQPRKRRREPDLIRLNYQLLQEHPREMIEETIPHELAHIVANRLFGSRIKPHGNEWRGVMQAFGKSPDVQHSMAVEPSRRLRRFQYHCGCPTGVQLTSIRHKRVRRGAAYLCRKCGQRLRWAGYEAVEK